VLATILVHSLGAVAQLLFRKILERLIIPSQEGMILGHLHSHYQGIMMPEHFN